MKKEIIRNYYYRMFKLCREFWSQSSTVKRETLKKARVFEKGSLEKFLCCVCQGLFARSEIQCDHKFPIAIEPTNIYLFLRAFERLESTHLQVLCKACHSLKTKSEMNDRRLDEMKQAIIKSDFADKYLISSLSYNDTRKLLNNIVKYQECKPDKKEFYIRKINHLLGEI